MDKSANTLIYIFDDNEFLRICCYILTHFKDQWMNLYATTEISKLLYHSSLVANNANRDIIFIASHSTKVIICLKTEKNASSFPKILYYFS